MPETRFTEEDLARAFDKIGMRMLSADADSVEAKDDVVDKMLADLGLPEWDDIMEFAAQRLCLEHEIVGALFNPLSVVRALTRVFVLGLCMGSGLKEEW